MSLRLGCLQFWDSLRRCLSTCERRRVALFLDRYFFNNCFLNKSVYLFSC